MSRFGSLPLLFILMMIGFPSNPMLAATQDRITASIDANETTTLHGNIHPLVAKAEDEGPLENSTMLRGMTLNFKLSAEQQSNLDALIKAQQDPASPQYHQWLTPAQFGAQFAVSDNDLNKVSAWLQSQGFAIEHIADSRNAIRFSGTAGQVQQAFHTEVHQFKWNGETHFAIATEPNIPSALADVVAGIHGLDDFPLHPRVMKSKPPSETVDPLFTSGVSQKHYLSPGDIATISAL